MVSSTIARSGLPTDYSDGDILTAGSVNEMNRISNQGFTLIYSDFVGGGNDETITYTLPSGTVTKELLVEAHGYSDMDDNASDANTSLTVTIAGGSEIDSGITGVLNTAATSSNGKTAATYVATSWSTGLDWSGTDIDVVANPATDSADMNPYVRGIIVWGR